MSQKQLVFLCLQFFLTFDRIFISAGENHESLSSKQTQISNLEGYQIPDDFRLPGSIIPLNYKIDFLLMLDEALPGYEEFSANGEEWITVECLESTSTITLHSLNITIMEVDVKDLATNSSMEITDVSYTEEFDFMNIHLSSSLQQGNNYEVHIQFTVPIYKDRLNGMYQDFYVRPETNETRYIATTLFAPYHSRRCYPNFDEPGYRATYDIKIGHHSQYHAISNGEIIGSEPMEEFPGWQWDTFARTPSIASYIMAFIVSDLEYEEAPPGSFRNVSIRVYAKPESVSNGSTSYSVQLSAEVMSFLESMFLVPYPLPKLYSIALPQFFFNAMENWGAITYKEPVLLYIPGETTEEERFQINYVLSHEESHQYFGNLVTQEWWAYVWLKEGFSTYFGYHAMNHTNPELLPWEEFIPQVLQVAMEFDTSNETHPLENSPISSEDVANIYTAIPYEKGASILRLAAAMYSFPVFLSGIKSYVEKFQYSTVDQDDMFQEIQGAVDDSTISEFIPATVKEIMDTWTRQSGFPLVTVQIVDSATIEITQEKYIVDDPTNPDDTWWVPIFLEPRPNVSIPDEMPDAWIPQFSRNIQIQMDTDQTIIVDPENTGYYRVSYDETLFLKICDALKNNYRIFPSSFRIKILSDYWAFLKDGRNNVNDLLRLTSYLENEDSIVVWKTIENIANILTKRTSIKNSSNLLNHLLEKAIKFQKRLELNIIQSISDDNMQLSSITLKIICKITPDKCRNYLPELEKDFQESYIEFVKRIPLEIQEILLCSTVYDDSGAALEIIQEIERGFVRFSPLKIRMLRSLTCTKNEAILKKIVSRIIENDDSPFDSYEKREFVKSLVNSRTGTGQIIRLLETNAQWILELFQDSREQRKFFDNLALDDQACQYSAVIEKLRLGHTPE